MSIITCYSWGNNKTRSPSSDFLLRKPDRLCNSNVETSVIIRAVCANDPWTLQTCAQICLNINTDDTGDLLRVNIWSDGSSCYHDQPNCCWNTLVSFSTQTGWLKDTQTANSFLQQPPPFRFRLQYRHNTCQSQRIPQIHQRPTPVDE